MGFSRPEVGWVEEAGTERDGEGTTGCASFRPTSLARAARPHAARGQRQAAVSTSKNRAARPRPNFAGAAERGAGAARDGEGTAGCARFRLASLPHAARPHALRGPRQMLYAWTLPAGMGSEDEDEGEASGGRTVTGARGAAPRLDRRSGGGGSDGGGSGGFASVGFLQPLCHTLEEQVIGGKLAVTTSRASSHASSSASSRASSRASSFAGSEEEAGEDGGGDVSMRQAKGEERYAVRVVCVDPKKEFGKMATGQQQLPKKPNISFSVTIKESPLTQERSRDIVQLVLEKLPDGPLSENDVVKLGCKSLKRGNIIAEINVIDESTDEDGGEAARSAWSNVSAFFVQRFGEAGAKIHKLEELRENECLKEGFGGKFGRAQKGEEEKDLNKSMDAGSTSAAKACNLNSHHERWGGGVSGKLAYGGHVDQVFAPTYGGNVDQVCDPVFFPGSTFDEASSDELSDGGALTNYSNKVPYPSCSATKVCRLPVVRKPQCPRSTVPLAHKRSRSRLCLRRWM
jgi:hypothetical protein